MRNQVFKKLFSVLLALIMVAGLLPASAMAGGWGAMDVDTTPELTETEQPTESAEPTKPAETETPEVTEVPEPTPENPAATVEPTQGEPTAEPTDEGIMPANVMPVQANVAARDTSGDDYYRIVHLDCGRKYFDVNYIKGIIDTMYLNGYNQLQLAFGNGGLRFVLDGMSQDLKDAIAQGNKKFHDSTTNELTQAEMTEIISYAKGKNIEIVPLLNMPGHMDGILSSDKYSGYKLNGSEGSLDLNNENAVAFGKELLSMYVEYFKTQGCKFFNFGADEYGIGIRNPYIESYVAQVTYNQLINYMNACAEIIENAGMTARCFNDFVCYNNRTSCDLKKSVQVCYWSNQWSGSEYNTVDVINNAGYKLINTNQKWYFVPSKADEYGKNVVLSNFKNFDVTKFQNIKSGWNSTSTTYSQITGGNNVGAMFCVWCDTPSVAVDLSDVKELIAAMADANPTYFTKVTIPNTTVGNATTADNDTVRVTGPNLEALKCDTATVTIQGAAEGKIAAYDVTPSTADSYYTEKAEVRIKIPAEWDKTKVKAFIVEDGTAKDIDGTATEDGWYVFTAPHFSVMGIYEKAAEYLDGGTHDVPKGGELKLDRIEGENLAGEYHTADSSIATVEVTGEDEKTGSGFDYISENVNYPKYCTSSTRTKLEGYYFKYNNTYYEVYVRTYTQYWTTYYECTYFRNNNYTRINRTTDASTTVSLYKRVSNTQPAYTDITFKGHEIGTTTVVIGRKKYTINVIDPVLAQQVLPINLWITNTGVVPTGWSNGTPTPAEFTYSDDGGNRRSIYTLKASHSTVNSPNGISLSSILPKVTGTAKSWDGNTYNVTYWKSAYHTAENRQSTDGWTNYSHKGIKFEYIRFYEGSWAYSVDGNTWVNIENVGAGADDTTKNQVCIWYRQVTTVTSEVTTEIVDWGPIQYGANQCLLDFAVKYDGTANRIPNSFPVTGKTIGFDCPTDQTVPLGNGYVVKDTDGTYYRTVYGIAGVETLNYEVYMITVTPTSDTHTDYVTKGTKPTELNYGGTEKIAWAKTERDANASELGKTSDIEYGGEPFLESVKIYRYQGLLVTYYLRAKETTESLSVHYAIDGTNVEFHKYNIIVKANEDGTYPTFNENIGLNQTNKKGPLDHGTIVNSNNVTITVSSDLSTLNNLEPQYRYSDYEVVRSERKDSKNVWIYYTFKREHTYVIDFGLPLNIQFSDFGVTDTSDIKAVSFVENEIVTKKTGTHGTAEVIEPESGKKYVRYTLEKPLGQNITIPLFVTFTNGTKTLFSANIIPATNVYYEDSFAKFNHGAGAAASAMWTPVYDPGTDANTNANTTQALEALGQTDHNPYGYDPAYQNSTMFSMGSARKVTVTSDMAKDGVVWPTAQFTFKGTGFDIISLTNNTSGAIFVFVYKGTDTSATGTRERSHIVDNYYGYTYDETTKTWSASPSGGNNALYQIPVMRIRDLEYGEYTAVVKVFYDEGFNHTTKSEYSFWLDAVRVYDPMGESVNTGNTYGQDGEAYPQYIKLRSELKKLNSGETASSGALFIDGKENANISEYANYGPNNEVYLAKGQAITFKLAGTDLSKIETVQIGAKAPNGTARLVVNNGEAKVLGTATEMYYDITTAAVNNGAQLVTVTNTGEAILSLTNLKITYAEGNQTVSLGEVSAEQKTQAVQMVRALFAPAPVEPEPEPEPEKTFEPERFEASWNKNVMQGKKATLTVKTSEDVEAITVDGQTIRSYRTRTERVGFGRRAKRITYREFTYSMVAQESADFSVTAINAEGTESEAITARLTVKTRPNSLRDMWDWFKGWF